MLTMGGIIVRSEVGLVLTKVSRSVRPVEAGKVSVAGGGWAGSGESQSKRLSNGSGSSSDSSSSSTHRGEKLRAPAAVLMLMWRSP